MSTYKISGTTSTDSIVLVINESDWILEDSAQKSAGYYEMTTTSGLKTVISMQNNGNTLGYGHVIPVIEHVTVSGTFKSTAGTDDGHISNVGAMYFNNNSDVATFGSVSGDGGRAFFRFPDITIPNGATITSAVLYVLSDTSTQWDGYVKVKVGFNNIDTAVAPTDVDTTEALTMTSGVVWEPQTFTQGTWYNTPDLADELQVVVDRGGWSSGNAIMLLMDEDGSTVSKRRLVHTYEDGSSNRPYLELEWYE